MTSLVSIPTRKYRTLNIRNCFVETIRFRNNARYRIRPNSVFFFLRKRLLFRVYNECELGMRSAALDLFVTQSHCRTDN